MHKRRRKESKVRYKKQYFTFCLITWEIELAKAKRNKYENMLDFLLKGIIVHTDTESFIYFSKTNKSPVNLHHFRIVIKTKSLQPVNLLPCRRVNQHLASGSGVTA